MSGVAGHHEQRAVQGLLAPRVRLQPMPGLSAVSFAARVTASVTMLGICAIGTWPALSISMSCSPPYSPPKACCSRPEWRIKDGLWSLAALLLLHRLVLARLHPPRSYIRFIFNMVGKYVIPFHETIIVTKTNIMTASAWSISYNVGY